MAKLVIDTVDLFDTVEAAQQLGIGYATIYRWIKLKKLLPVRLGGRTLIPKNEIERLKETMK